MKSCEFARAIGVGASEYCALEAMRLKPIGVGKDRIAPKWKPIAVKVAGALGVEPDVLWPEAVLEIKKTINDAGRASRQMQERQQALDSLGNEVGQQ